MNTYHRHTEAVISIGWLIRCAAICLVFGASCVGFLHQKEALHHKAEHVRTLERELRSLKRSNQLKQEELVALTSPQRLELEVRRRGLDLVAPKPEDILSLPLPDPQLAVGPSKKAASPDNSRYSLSRVSYHRLNRRYLP
jgi:hypothetical protein